MTARPGRIRFTISHANHSLSLRRSIPLSVSEYVEVMMSTQQFDG
jgi:hypothetical protein